MEGKIIKKSILAENRKKSTIFFAASSQSDFLFHSEQLKFDQIRSKWSWNPVGEIQLSVIFVDAAPLELIWEKKDIEDFSSFTEFSVESVQSQSLAKKHTKNQLILKMKKRWVLLQKSNPIRHIVVKKQKKLNKVVLQN